MSDSFATQWAIVPSLLGSSAAGILQARILEWVAISFSRIFLTQGSNLRLLHWQADSLPLNHWEAPVQQLFLEILVTGLLIYVVFVYEQLCL